MNKIFFLEEITKTLRLERLEGRGGWEGDFYFILYFQY